jgi:hypothetical protein
MFCRLLFVLFPLAIVLSACPFGIFKLFLHPLLSPGRKVQAFVFLPPVPFTADAYAILFALGFFIGFIFFL